MLDFLRRKAQSTTIQVTILLIVLVFIFWGVGTNQNGGPDAIATVNKQSINYEQYQRTYEQTLARYRDQFGGNLPAGLLEALNLKEQVLNQLIQQLVMQQGATESGLIASNEEVRKIIQEMESFRENGVFNLDRYKTLLTSSKMTPAEFENSIRTDLLNNKILTHLAHFARVSDGELRDRFALENDAVKLEFVSFAAGDFKGGVTIAEPELTAFYEKSKAAYQTEPQVKLKYLSILYDQAAAGTPPFGEEQIEQYYTMNSDKFSFPEQRRARHILVKSDEKESPELRAGKRQKLETILALAKAGKDFAQLAKEYSDDLSGSEGGDLGFFTRGQMVAPFDEAVFAMKEGTLSDIVETPFGFHIIKLEAITPAKVISLAEAREQIIGELQKRQGREVAFTLANQAYEGIIAAGSLDKYATGSHVPAKETDFFSRLNPPREFADNAALLNTAFSLKKGELSSLVETGDGFAVLYVEDVKEPQVPPLAEVRARVERDFVADRAKTLAREAAVTLLATAKKEASLAAGAGKANADLRESGFFSKGTVAASGLPGAVAAQGLKLNAAAPFPETVGENGDTFYVLRFKEIRKASEEEFTRQKAALAEMLKQEKQIQLMGQWLSYLQADAKITTNKKFLQ
ncbi:SurA N-terminal domain-containing protein [Thiovibrio sp. JS02]